jgi:hypothetical protein
MPFFSLYAPHKTLEDVATVLADVVRGLRAEGAGVEAYELISVSRMSAPKLTDAAIGICVCACVWCVCVCVCVR